MVRFAALAALVTSLGACTDDAAQLEPALLAEVCGAPGPFHLLPLAPDERVGPEDKNFAVVGERLLFIASKGQRSLSPVVGPLPETTTVYAVGPCGEDPVVVAQDIGSIHEEPLWPGVALGCTMRGRDLVRLDPSGAAEPVLLAADACGATVTRHGLLRYVSTDDNRYTANFFPLLDPAGPTFGAPILVAEPAPATSLRSKAVLLLPDEVLLLEAGGDLVSFALPGLTRTVLQAGVVTFDASDDARYLLYQVGTTIVTDPSNPIGKIYIRDRLSGISAPIGAGPLGHGHPHFFAPDAARVTLSSPNDHQRTISLPAFKIADAPEGHELIAPLPDGRWLSKSDNTGPWHVLDLEAGQATLVSSNQGLPRAYTEQHLDLLLNGSSDLKTALPLVRFFFDGRKPQILAERANRDAIVREDGQILTMVDVDATWLGALTLVDPSTREASHIADHVVPAQILDHWVHPTEPDTLVYSVVDGERTGVWLARPAPLE